MLWYKSWLETRWRFFIGLALLTLSATGALFTLSLPVSRNRLIGVRVATGIAELLAMALVSSLVLPVLSPAVGQSYSVGDALIHRRVLVHCRRRALQPGHAAINRVQRRVASAALRPLRSDRDKAKPKVATAIARELAGFIWAIARGGARAALRFDAWA